MSKQPYRINPIRADFLAKVRVAGLDDQNQQVEVSFAKGGEPCRDVLRAAKANEKIILASYCPFTISGPYKEYGPVFVLADQGQESARENQLPFPVGPLSNAQTIANSDYLGAQFVMKAYTKSERISDAKLATKESAYDILDTFFADTANEFVLVRYAAYGCYSCRIERY